MQFYQPITGLNPGSTVFVVDITHESQLSKHGTYSGEDRRLLLSDFGLLSR